MLRPGYFFTQTNNGPIQTTWAASSSYGDGSTVIATVGSVTYSFKAGPTGGISGASAPTWSATLGATVSDGTVTWTNTGINNFVGSDLLKPKFTETTFVTGRSMAVFCPCYSTIFVDFAPGVTGSVSLLANPFDGAPIAKDRPAIIVQASTGFTLATSIFTVSASAVTTGAGIYLLSVTSITGQTATNGISARAVFEQDVVC